VPRKTPTRSARETSSAKDRTCIFSITMWRWALIVRSVQPNDLAACLLVCPSINADPRQRQIYEIIVRGKTNKHAARELDSSERTRRIGK
jgi:DNA-binding NarL/FixJ family response regulator